MGKFRNVLNKIFNRKTFIGSLNSDSFKKWLGIETDKGVLNEATYFTCLKMLSEAKGKLPIVLYRDTERGTEELLDSTLSRVLKIRPNPYTTPSIFWSTMEMNKIHFGNAYAWIRRDGIEVDSIWIMQSDHVDIIFDDVGLFGTSGALWYRYNDPVTGALYTFNSDEVIHFKTSTTLDGILGVSVREKLANMIEGSLASQNFMTNLHKEGLTARAILQYTGDLDEPTKKRLIEGMNKFATGAENAGKIIPIPLGMQLTPLNIKLTDAQFEELRKLNARQIAAAFGVKPNQLNDYENSNYSNSEMQQLSFYIDSLLYTVKNDEEELIYKLLRDSQIEDRIFIQHDIDVILRADMKTQSDVLSTYVNNSILRPNEARRKLKLPADPDGDKLIANGNYIPLSQVGTQYIKQSIQE